LLTASVGGRPTAMWMWSGIPPMRIGFIPFSRAIPPRKLQTRSSISWLIQGSRFFVLNTKWQCSEVKVLPMRGR